MSTRIDGDPQHFFHSKAEIVEHLLAKVRANTKKLIGSEWELFVYERAGPPSLSTTDKILHRLADVFKDDAATPIMEEGNVIGVDVPNLGAITLEIGGQFEFSATVSTTPDDIEKKNARFIDALRQVEGDLNFHAQPVGYSQAFENTHGSVRARSRAWMNVLQQQGPRAPLRFLLLASASNQISVDAGGDNFHEYFKVLLLFEPVLALHFSNSERLSKSAHAIIDPHLQPITTVWNAKNTPEALDYIVDHLLDLPIPFLPREPDNKPVNFPVDQMPTCRTLMAEGKLSEKILNYAASFMFSRPAFRNFVHALIEIRGVDSQPSPEKIREFAARVEAIVYDDVTRRSVLADYAHLTEGSLIKLHQAATLPDKKVARAIALGNGTTVGGLMDDLLTRSQPAIAPAPRMGQPPAKLDTTP